MPVQKPLNWLISLNQSGFRQFPAVGGSV